MLPFPVILSGCLGKYMMPLISMEPPPMIKFG
jgi:hypothetical protein